MLSLESMSERLLELDGSIGEGGGQILRTSLPLALRGEVPSELTLTGGTHVTTSPCYHFLDITWRRYVEQCGLRVGLRMVRPGFYPRGGGVVEAFVQPCPRLHGLRLPQRGPVRAGGFSAVAGLDPAIAKRQARRAAYRLEQAGLKAKLREETWEGGPGTVLAVELDTA